METSPTIRREADKVSPECPHCAGGWIYEPTEDTLIDEAHECFMCLGTGRRMARGERISLRADLDAQHAGLERLGG